MPVEIIDAPPVADPPKPTTELHVTPETIDHGPMPDEPKPGSARFRMVEALRAKAKDPGEATPPARTAKPAEAKPVTEEKPLEAKAPGTEDAPKPEDAAKAAPAPEDKKKVNPWKLVDQYKGEVGKLQEEITKLRTSALPVKEREDLVARADKAEQRAKALEDHIRFVDYSKSEEFQKKYQEPYEKAWAKHMKELGQIKVQVDDTQTAPLEAQHLLNLVNLPLEEAQELAEQMNPRFANHLMGARKEIRDLFEAQSEALAEAKKNGTERIKQTIEQQTKQMGEINKYVTENWDASIQSLVRDDKYGLYFTPVEGDQEVNQRLAKGEELVKRAFSEDPRNPNLTPDERRAIIKRHAAVYWRAASWGRLRYDLERTNSKVAELETELKKYRGSTPPSGGSPRAAGEPARPGKASDEVFAALRAKAR